MKIIDSLEQLHIEEDTAVAIGKFDGIHLGHQALLKEILKAKEKGFKAAVFTFYPSPAVVFGGGEEQLRGTVVEPRFQSLSTREEKRQFLKEAGIDYFVEYPLDLKTAAIDPAEFIQKLLVEQMKVKLVVAGPDLSFGAKGRGDFELLKKYSEICGYEARQIDKVCKDGQEISSTRVRAAVERGDMKEAEQCLGNRYAVSGIVRHGAKLGRSMGFPTVNVIPEKEKLLPPFGVYHSIVTLDGHRYAGVTNIGRKPTVHQGKDITVETFLFHFAGDAYGKRIRVELLQFVRPERRFEDQEQLQHRIDQDVKCAEQFFKANEQKNLKFTK